MNSSVRISVLVAVVVLPGLVLAATEAAASDARVWELEEILEEARQYAPLLEQHQARRQHAEARSQRADRAWWPTLETDSRVAPVPADADPTRIDENIDEIVSFNLGPYFRQTARVTMPVYTFGRVKTARELAQLGVDVAELERQEAMHDHLQRTRQAYYGRQLAGAFEKLLSEGGELVRETLAQMEEDRAFGEADFDVEELRRLQIFESELDTMVLDNERLGDLTESALRHLTDVDGSIGVAPLEPEDAQRSLAGVDIYQAVARAHRPELRQLERGIEARRLQEQMARREFYPNFYVGADFQYGWSTEDPALQRVCRRDEPGGPCSDADDLFARPYVNPFDTLSFGVAVGMRWEFDFARKQGELREAQAQSAEIEAQYQQAVAALELEIEETWRRARDARRRVDIEQRRYDAARRWRNQYGLQEQFVYAGEEDVEDLIEPLQQFYEARVGLLEATHAYLTTRAELARKIGVERLVDVHVDGERIFVDGQPLAEQ